MCLARANSAEVAGMDSRAAEADAAMSDDQDERWRVTGDRAADDHDIGLSGEGVCGQICGPNAEPGPQPADTPEAELRPASAPVSDDDMSGLGRASRDNSAKVDLGADTRTPRGMASIFDFNNIRGSSSSPNSLPDPPVAPSALSHGHRRLRSTTELPEPSSLTWQPQHGKASSLSSLTFARTPIVTEKSSTIWAPPNVPPVPSIGFLARRRTFPGTRKAVLNMLRTVPLFCSWTYWSIGKTGPMLGMYSH